MDGGELRKILKEEIGTNLNQISESIKQLKPKAKGPDYAKMLLWTVGGALILYLLYKIYILVQVIMQNL